jgi:hypothetical protein
MRILWAGGLCLILLSAALPCTGADDSEARAVVARAVKVQGGIEALQRAATASRKGKGSLFLTQETPFSCVETFHLPDQLRTSLELGRTPYVRVLDGDKGWVLQGGTTTDMSRVLLAEVREEAYVWWLVTLAPLVKEEFELTRLPEAKVNGRPASGVRASRKDRPDCALYFDKEDGHLVRIVRRARDAGVEVSKEYLYGDYKDIDGARQPTRETVLVNGAKTSEVSYSDYRLLRRADDKEFQKP